MNKGTLDELKKVKVLDYLPQSSLEWILEHSDYREFDEGTILSETGKPIDHLWLISEGLGKFYMDVNGKLVYYFDFTNNKETGGAGGLIPYSRMINSPGYTYAVGKVKIFFLHKKYFKELEDVEPVLVQRLIGYMTERARRFATLKLQFEKVNALGQLAAGIAHELNNPASAIIRISAELMKIINKNYELTENLLRTGAKPDVITSLRIIADRKTTEGLSLMDKIDRESDISEWLEENKVKDQGNSPATFAEAGIEKNDLECAKDLAGSESLREVIHWFENYLSARKILGDLENSSGKISKLVDAIKSHVRMDRTNELLPTDIHKDIEDSLTLLGHKIRDKGIKIKRNFENELPVIQTYAGELNQVWTNLIDNAIFASDKKGIISIETYHDKKNIFIRITDEGRGIPQDIISKIFDPFFTTKKAGEGTGIGLDLVMRIIRKHKGEITVSSVPGKTEFTVSIPLNLKSRIREEIQL